MQNLLQKMLLIALCFSLIACSDEQEEIKVIDNIDANQYVGTWYEIARLDHSFERGLQNVTANYIQNADGTIKVINRGYNAKKNEWNEAEGKAYFVDPANKDGTHTGKLKVSFFGPFYAPYHIIDLDRPYYNYAMVTSGKDYLWILSRTPQLAYPIKQHLVARAKELGFATDELIYVPQTVEIINYKAGPHVNP
ncbi:MULTISPECIES: lipocalin family protein [Methylotenera]|uniref:lipocalin family protein n=1 Tax=Methylotenera TaxID=359407 RepID=UPI000380D3CA|nr:MULTISPECIES: lipocalin family protein [Methylotenera]